MGKTTKNINIEIEHECWKKLKIISIDKDITLQEVVRDILVRATNTTNKRVKVSDTNNGE